MRSGLLISLLVCGCGPVQKAEVRPTAVPQPSAPPVAPTASPCTVKTHAVSIPARGGVRPDVATVGGAFAVVWEETERHPGIHFQAFDADANPLGPGVEVADLERGGAEPRVVAAGGGYVVVWTVDQPDTAMIAVRRVDAKGKPLGDVVPAVATPNARPLAAAAVSDGLALAWWTWSADPPTQNLTWLDASLKPRGKAVTISKGPLVEPQIALQAAGSGVRAAWIEPIDGADHVFTGELSRTALSKRIDLGPGDDPSIAEDSIVFTTLDDGAVFRARLGDPKAAKIAEGQNPDADDHVLCLVSYGTGEQSPGDVLRCHALEPDKLGPERRLLTVPGGVLTLRVAQAGDTTGLVYQTEAEGGRMVVSFAAVRCAKP